MPKFFGDDGEEEVKKPALACQGLREDLKECLVNSDCVQKVSSNYITMITNVLSLSHLITTIIVSNPFI